MTGSHRPLRDGAGCWRAGSSGPLRSGAEAGERIPPQNTGETERVDSENLNERQVGT